MSCISGRYLRWQRILDHIYQDIPNIRAILTVIDLCVSVSCPKLAPPDGFVYSLYAMIYYSDSNSEGVYMFILGELI